MAYFIFNKSWFLLSGVIRHLGQWFLNFLYKNPFIEQCWPPPHLKNFYPPKMTWNVILSHFWGVKFFGRGESILLTHPEHFLIIFKLKLHILKYKLWYSVTSWSNLVKVITRSGLIQYVIALLWGVSEYESKTGTKYRAHKRLHQNAVFASYTKKG